MKVVNVGPSQTMVRIHASDNYLMLPVQESVDDSKVELLVNGRIVKTFYVRLANNEVDYSVPFDLRPYADENVVLRITAPHSQTVLNSALHAGEKNKRKELWLSDLKLTDTFDITNTEKYRPIYHHTPQYGWMNDPNGMFYKDGVWNLYYQWNPYGSRWQNMTWGHSTSTDLVNWEHHPVAIEPNDLGSIFSGSAAIDHNNTAGFGNDAVVALYTSAGDYQMQSLASSTDDGMTFENYADNPVITLPTEARDPNMFYNAETGLWNLVLAHALEKEILIFSSPDLKTWTLQSAFGKGLGARDGVWECPDLFELSLPSGEKKWMMIVNLNPGGPFGGSATQYFIGDFDGKTFTADTTPGGYVPTKWLDFGKDFYATVSWSDAPAGRRTAIGWMSNWQYADQVPTLQFRSANSLPREIGLFKAADGQIYASSMPSPELKKLRGAAYVNLTGVSINKTGRAIELPAANDGACEINLEIASSGNPVWLTLSNDKGDEAVMVYDPKTHLLSFDRTHSGVVDFNENFPALTVAPTFENNGKLGLQIFIDRSSIEVFEKDGKFSMTNLVFPNAPFNRLQVNTTAGNARLSRLAVYPLSLDNTK
ncbi:MAG: DUF4980 domain-containing protein [Muribaculaceae bacterium]|nr:DUF4980 domain-containing protein [Muribaculaceae bacterium]